MRKIILSFLLLALSAKAQEPQKPIPPPAAPQKENTVPPLEVDAGSLIADQKENSVLLKDKVEAIQGDMHLWADEVWSAAPPGTQFGFKNPKTVEAQGQVIAKTPTQKGSADTATYEAETQRLHLEGKEVHLIGKEQRLTSYESIDYWEEDLKAIARKNVVLHAKDKVIKTEELVVLFKKNAAGRLEFSYAFSPTRVSIATPEEIFIGDQGTYNMETGQAVLEGNVSVTHLADQSRLFGAYATIDMNTGVSKLYAKPPVSSTAKPVAIQGKLPKGKP
ncbi:MAG: hypothetical protein LBH38_00915 [Holosporales bacterium]|jgi:lipopolysaccharide transport protein LptA|nr:hypothetical protein [Holosporales bacterium]